MKTFAATLVIAITLTGFAISPAVALADAPAPQYQVFFPVVFGPPPTPAPLPTPLPPTTPVTGTVQTLWPVRAVGAASQHKDYTAALVGRGGDDGNVSGSDSLLFTPPQRLSYSLITTDYSTSQSSLFYIWRQFIEFDTIAIPADFETAQFNLTIFVPYPGPPAHHIAIHRGTWTDNGLTDANGQLLTPENWGDYDPTPLAILPGAGSGQSVTVTLPREVINPGGITKLLFRSTTEGTVPARYLGGAFSGLSLTVK